MFFSRNNFFQALHKIRKFFQFFDEICSFFLQSFWDFFFSWSFAESWLFCNPLIIFFFHDSLTNFHFICDFLMKFIFFCDFLTKLVFFCDSLMKFEVFLNFLMKFVFFFSNPLTKFILLSQLCPNLWSEANF